MQNKTTMYIILLISQLFLFNSCEGQTAEPTTFSKKIEKKVAKIAKEKNIPSLELTVTTEKNVLNFNYHHKDVAKQNIYGIGSTTKFLSAVLVFKLIENQTININDKVTDYVDIANSINGIENLTIKNLLNHTSGLSDYTKNPVWIIKVTNNEAPKTFEEKLVLINSKLENSGNFSYSNSNYLFLQKIVEKVTNKPYDVVFNEFYKSLNLSEIQIGMNENGLQAFFGQTEQGSSDVSSWREKYGFDGGAYSNSKTLDNFLTKLYREKSILNPNTLSEMENWVSMQPMTIPVGSGLISEYGNGIMKLKYNGQEYIGHFGSTLKYQSMVLYNSEKNISISVVTNCSGKHFNNVFFQELIPAILDEL